MTIVLFLKHFIFSTTLITAPHRWLPVILQTTEHFEMVSSMNNFSFIVVYADILEYDIILVCCLYKQHLQQGLYASISQ